MVTKINFIKKKNLKNATLFVGLPGIGLVGKICVDYMLKEFKPEKIAEVTSDSFPPSVQTEKGLISLIKDEIYYLSLKGKDYLFLSGPVQPTLDIRAGSMDEHFEFSRAIVKELKEIGLGEICTLAGINIGEKRMHAEPRVIIAASNKNLLETWKKHGAINDGPVGLISGAAGLLVGIGNEEGVEGTCLMGETNARLVYGDPGAAKKVLEVLMKKFSFKMEMSKMEKEAKEIEKAFSSLTKQFEGQDEVPSTGLSYVR